MIRIKKKIFFSRVICKQMIFFVPFTSYWTLFMGINKKNIRFNELSDFPSQFIVCLKLYPTNLKPIWLFTGQTRLSFVCDMSIRRRVIKNSEFKQFVELWFENWFETYGIGSPQTVWDKFDACQRFESWYSLHDPTTKKKTLGMAKVKSFLFNIPDMWKQNHQTDI